MVRAAAPALTPASIAAGSPDDASVVYNDEQNPTPATEDLPAPSEQTCEGSSMTVTLPGYSVTVLDFMPGNATRLSIDGLPSIRKSVRLSNAGDNCMTVTAAGRGGPIDANSINNAWDAASTKISGAHPESLRHAGRIVIRPARNGLMNEVAAGAHPPPGVSYFNIDGRAISAATAAQANGLWIERRTRF